MENVLTTSLEEVTSSTANRVVTIVQLVYGLPSLLLMIVFLVFFIVSKNYSHSFYRIIQLDLITNIFCYLNTWIALRMESERAGVFVLKQIELLVPGFLTWTKYAASCFLHLQFLTAIALSLHRIGSILYHAKNEQLWSRFWGPFGAVCLVYSYIPGLFYPKKVAQVTFSNGTLTRIYYLDLLSAWKLQAAIFSAVYFVLLLLTGLSTSYLVSHVFTRMNVSDRGLSKKLTKIALTYCFVSAGILFYSVLTILDGYFNFIPKFYTNFNVIIMLTASDLMTLALPYILIIHDSNVRNDILKWIRRNKFTGTNRVFVSASGTNY